MSYPKLTAKLPEKESSNAKNYGNGKETISTYNIVVLNKKDKTMPMKDLITCRFYMGRSRSASVVYCSVWVHHEKCYTSGTGNAGGYGYHKESAALDEALRSAGVKLSRSINGTGETEEALKAVAAACGFRKMLVVRN